MTKAESGEDKDDDNAHPAVDPGPERPPQPDADGEGLKDKADAVMRRMLPARIDLFVEMLHSLQVSVSPHRTRWSLANI